VPEPLKVLYTSSFGDYRGGGQRSLELLLDYIRPLGVDPIVVAPERGGFLDRIEKKGMATAVVPQPRLRVPMPVPILRFRRTVRRLVLDRQVRLVHTDATRSTLLYGASVCLDHRKR